nr:InlB B-repeat-containing protein [Solobacterium sp.]
MYKKLFVVLMSLFLSVTVLPQNVFAEEETGETEEEIVEIEESVQEEEAVPEEAIEEGEPAESIPEEAVPEETEEVLPEEEAPEEQEEVIPEETEEPVIAEAEEPEEEIAEPVQEEPAEEPEIEVTQENEHEEEITGEEPEKEPSEEVPAEEIVEEETVQEPEVITEEEEETIQNDESADGLEDAILLTEGETVQISSESGEPVYLKFIPSESANYKIWSFDNEGVDPLAELLDENGDVLLEDDDGAGNLNFSLKQELEAGTTYYIQARSYSSSFAYSVAVGKYEVVSITFDANGGWFDNEDDTERTYKFETGDYFSSIYALNHSDSNMSFAGWATAPDAEEPDVFEGQTPVSELTTVYAVWAESVQITLNANGGVFNTHPGDLDEDGQFVNTYAKFKTIDLQQYRDIIGYSSILYECAGFSEDPDASPDDAVLSYKVVSPVVLYAVFRRHPGTEASLNQTISGTIEGNSEYWIEFVPEETGGYTFITEGRYSYPEYRTEDQSSLNNLTTSYTDEDGKEHHSAKVLLQAGKHYAIRLVNNNSEACEFTAQVVEGESVSVTYDANGGYINIDDNPALYTETVIPGKYFEAHGSEFVKNYDAHMRFAGWAMTPDAVEPDINSNTMIESDITVYAVWVNEYTVVTLDANGGRMDPDQDPPLLIEELQYYAGDTLYLSSYTPSKNLWQGDFAGWALTPDADVTEVLPNDEPYVITEDITFYAVYEYIEVVELPEGVNAGLQLSGSERKWASFSPEDSGKYVLELELLGELESEDYLYLEVNNSEDSQINSHFIFNNRVNLYEEFTDSRTYYLSFETESSDIMVAIRIKKSYANTVTYDANGGWFDNEDNTVRTEEFESDEYFRSYTPNHSDPALRFAGWATTPDAEEADVIEGQTLASELTTIYAVWKSRTQIISLNESGTVHVSGGAEDQIYLEFIPLETAEYKIYSSENEGTDPYAKLLDENYDDLTSDDDSAGDRNFRLTQELEAGKTYYILVTSFSEGNFTYDVTAKKVTFVSVILDANGGQFNNGDTETTLDFDSDEYFYLEGDLTPWKDEMGFAGWATAPDTEEPDVIEGETPVSELTTVYAVWGEYVEITLNANGGYFTEEYDLDQAGQITKTYVKNATINLQWYKNDTRYSTLLYDCAGFSEDPDASADEAFWSYKVNGPAVLYAVFREYPGTEVSLDQTVTGTVSAGSEYRFEFIPEKTGGYSFISEGGFNDSYYVDENGYGFAERTETDYEDGIRRETVSAVMEKGKHYVVRIINDSDEDAEVTLQVSECSTVSVTYDANGGYINVDDNPSSYTETVIPGKNFEEQYTDFAKNNDAHMRFLGWATTPDAEEPDIDFNIIIESDITVYAVWENAYLVVTVDANGGLYNSDPHSYLPRYEIAADYGDEFYLRSNNLVHGWQGEFIGWALVPEADESELLTTDGPFIITEDITYYAIYEKSDRYILHENETIEIHPNYPRTVAEFTPEESGYYVLETAGNDGTDVSAECTVEVYEEDGYALASSNYTGELHFELAESKTYYVSFSNYDSIDTITVKITKPVSNTVTYDANGGYFDEDGHPQTITRSVVTGRNFDALYDNYVLNDDMDLGFVGWATAPDAEKPDIDSSTVIGSDITVYAVWNKTVTVTFITAEGYYETPGQTVIERKLVTGKEFWISGAKPLHSDQHKIFKGYSFTDGAEEPDLDWSFTVTEPVTLYAVWEEGFVITYNAGSGYIGDDTGIRQKTYTVSENEFFDDDIFAENEDDHFHFIGWASTENAAAADMNDSFRITQDTNVYAVWEERFVIRYDLNGYKPGKGAGRSVYPVKKNSVVNLYSLNGYSYNSEQINFEGWALSPDASAADVLPERYTITSDITVYAVSDPIQEITAGETYDVYYGFQKAFFFTPEESGTYKFAADDYTPGMYKGFEIKDSNNNTVGYEYHDSGSLSLFIELNAGETYTVIADKSNGYNRFSFKVEKADAFPVTLNANGGTFYENNADTYIALAEAGTLFRTISHSDLDREGYAMIGWSLRPDAAEPDDLKNFEITGPLTVYAVWKKYVNVSFDLNGGFYVSPYNDGYTEAILPNTAIRPSEMRGSLHGNNGILHEGDVMFAGWALSPDATGAEIVSEYTVESDVTFYAVWVPAVQVYFNGNGGNVYYSGFGEPEWNLPCIIGSALDCPFWTEHYTKLKVFTGWATTPDATVPDIDENTIVTESFTAYAVWEDGYTVTFEANGGNFGTDYNPRFHYSYAYKKGSAFGDNIKSEMYSDVRIPEPDNPILAFAGWATAPDAEEPDVDDSFVIDRDMKLYAVWKEPVYIVYDANGGIFEEKKEIKIHEKQLAGSSFNTPPYVPVNADESLAFLGWATVPNAEAPDIDSNTIVAENMTVYAVWGTQNTVTVTYDAGNGYFNGDPADTAFSKTYDKNIYCDMSDAPVLQPADESQEFLGWSEDGSISGIIDGFTAAGDTTLYAVYAARTIENARTELSVTTAVYSGTQIRPECSVSFYGRTLAEGTDYTVSYENNINAGTAAVTITGIGSFTGTVTKEFTITPKAITPAVSFAAEVISYDGTVKTPEVIVKDGETVLTKDTDYTVTYGEGRINAGTYTVTVDLTGNYTGTASAAFTINAKAVTPEVTLSEVSYIYDGVVKTPEITVKDGSTVLTAGIDYTAAYADGRIEPGTYTVTVTLTGNYSGTASAEFTILEEEAEPEAVLAETTYEYDGTVRTPEVTVTAGSKTLAENTDYTVAYSSGRIDAGTYTVTVNLTGRYSGTITKEFTITPKAIVPAVTLTTTSYTYNGSKRTPGVSVKDGDTTLVR